MNELPNDQKKYCSALCYYLNHIKLDLSHGRTEFLRSYTDHIGALISGYITKGQVYKGDWAKFKMTCYASKDALQLVQKINWSTRGISVTMEHVVPVNEIGTILQNLHGQKKSLTCQEILAVLKDLLIPCLITKNEDGWFRGRLIDSMPTNWTYSPSGNNQWARYERTNNPNLPSHFLIQNIVAISPPKWMVKSGFPNSNTVTLPHRLKPDAISDCDCLNSDCPVAVAQGLLVQYS